MTVIKLYYLCHRGSLGKNHDTKSVPVPKGLDGRNLPRLPRRAGTPLFSCTVPVQRVFMRNDVKETPKPALSGRIDIDNNAAKTLRGATVTPTTLHSNCMTRKGYRGIGPNVRLYSGSAARQALENTPSHEGCLSEKAVCLREVIL
jgi:hypothetical protein